MGLIPKPEPYPIDYGTVDQGFRGNIQSPIIPLPTSQEITSNTLFNQPLEFTTGAEINFPAESVSTTTETEFVTITERAILRLVTIAAIQYSGTWNQPCTLRWRIRRNDVDVLNIVRYMTTTPSTLGETFSLGNFIVQAGDLVYLRYSRNVTGASLVAHCHLHGTLLPEN